MKRTLLVLLTLFSWSASVWAEDIVEVRGKGFITGTIVSETKDTLTFKDSWGMETTFQKAELTHIERGKKIKRPAAGSAAAPSGSAKASFLDKLKLPKLPERFRWTEGEGVVGKVKVWLTEGSASLLEHFMQASRMNVVVPTKEGESSYVVDSFKELKEKNYGTGNFVLGGAAMALMFLGAFGCVVCGIVLIFAAFEEGFIWGLLWLGLPFSRFFAGYMAEYASLFYVLMLFACIYLIISRWESMRKPFVFQILGLDVVLLGFWLLKLAS